MREFDRAKTSGLMNPIEVKTNSKRKVFEIHDAPSS